MHRPRYRSTDKTIRLFMNAPQIPALCMRPIHSPLPTSHLILDFHTCIRGESETVMESVIGYSRGRWNDAGRLCFYTNFLVNQVLATLFRGISAKSKHRLVTTSANTWCSLFSFTVFRLVVRLRCKVWTITCFVHYLKVFSRSWHRRTRLLDRIKKTSHG